MHRGRKIKWVPSQISCVPFPLKYPDKWVFLFSSPLPLWYWRYALSDAGRAAHPWGYHKATRRRNCSMKPQGRGTRTSQNQKNPKPWTNKVYHLPDYHLGHHLGLRPPTPAELWEARGALSLPVGSPRLWERSSAQGPEPLLSWCQHSQWREHQGPRNLADAPARTQTTWLLTGQRICRTFCAYHPGAKMSFPFQARTLQPSPYPLPVPQTKPNKSTGGKNERMFHGRHRGRNRKRQPDWGTGGLIKYWATPAGMPCWAILPGLGSLTGPRVTLRIALQPVLLLLGNSWVGKLFSSQKSLKINVRSRNSSHSYFWNQFDVRGNNHQMASISVPSCHAPYRTHTDVFSPQQNLLQWGLPCSSGG